MSPEKPDEPVQPDKQMTSSSSTEGRSMLELRFPSDPGFLPMVRDLAHRLAESTGFDSEEAEKIARAVDDATIHVIESAYHGAVDREVEVHFDSEDERLAIQILHDGDALEEVPLPAFDLDKLVAERPEGGPGLSLMRVASEEAGRGQSGSDRNMSVEVHYQRRPAGGD